MFKTKLECFLAKRALIYLFFVSLAILAIMKEDRLYLLGGLFAGTCLSIARFSGYSWVFAKICDIAKSTSEPGRAGQRAVSGSFSAFMLNLAILLPIIYVSNMVNIKLLAGLMLGIMAIPAVIMVNSVTEALGITKNRFGI